MQIRELESTDKETLKFITRICQILVVETIYWVVSKSFHLNTALSIKNFERMSYCYQLIRSICIIFMFSGMGMSIRNVRTVKDNEARF